MGGGMAKDERNAEIRQWRKAGANLQQLSDRYGITPQRVGVIARDKKRGQGIPCPECGGDSQTVRTGKWTGDHLSRRHECYICGHRWTSRQHNL
jgi:hypothetical protein